MQHAGHADPCTKMLWIGSDFIEAELGGVMLVPNEEGGVFEVRLGGETIFSRKDAGRFPEMKELKRLVPTDP